MRTIALDTETTGFKFSEGHRMVEIGCVEMHNLIRTGNNFHVYINPQREVPIEAVNVHGLTYDKLKDKPLFADIVDDFFNFIEDSPLVIHNAQFDVTFLNDELKNIGRNILTNPIIDTLTLSRKKLQRLGRHNLDALCKYYKIDNSNRVLHGALLDADLLAQVYLELEGGASYELDFVKNKTIPSSNSNDIVFKHKNFSIDFFKATETELMYHEAMLKKFS